MTIAVRRHQTLALMLLIALAAAWGARDALAITLDDRGEMKLGLRAYTSVRVGTQQLGGSDNPLNYPSSPAGHVRQNRYFLQVDFDHDLTRLGEQGWGPARIFGLMDQGFDALGWEGKSAVKYTVQYRGEGEGIYNYGPSEYSDPGNKLWAYRLDTPKLKIPGLVNLNPALPPKYIYDRVNKLRRIGVDRQRLFLAYLDWDRGPLFIRIGKQVLAWGETDVFRLMDNINPLDDSFGGFFISLDERRLPIEMIRSSYRFGDVGPDAGLVPRRLRRHRRAGRHVPRHPERLTVVSGRDRRARTRRSRRSCRVRTRPRSGAAPGSCSRTRT